MLHQTLAGASKCRWPFVSGYEFMAKGKVHIGTSGWSYEDWKGVFYPPRLKSSEWLTYYAKTFDATEINSSFYRLPTKETVKNWVKKVPPSFKFCPKMSRYLTHFKKLREPEEPLERFFDRFKPMEKQIGPVLIQLHPTLKFDHDVAEYFLKLLKKKYKKHLFALEVRHESWMESLPVKLMEEYNIAFVISQSGVGFPYAELITAKHIFLRFHGPTTLYDSLYDKKTMLYYSKLVKSWQKKGHDCWIFFNNDWHGYGITNALQLEEELARGKGQRAKGKRQKARGKRQGAKDKRQGKKSKRQVNGQIVS